MGRSVRVAVIGAGISGLSATQHLLRQGVSVLLLERRSAPGGNVRTHITEVDGQMRSVDLGTSDFNQNTYHHVFASLRQCGIAHKPIHNSTSFSGDVDPFTLGLRVGHPPHVDIVASLRRFRREAYDALDDSNLYRQPVAAYLRAQGYPAEFGKHLLFPRIQGLWFCPPTGPESVPMGMVAHFYALQEGIMPQGADPTPDRRFVVGGTRRWIDALVSQLPQGVLHTGVDVRVAVSDTNPRLLGDWPAIDAVILATHAEDVAPLVENLPASMRELLAQFPYSSTRVVAHHSANELPTRNLWCSFNIRTDRTHPAYSMTLVVDRHQNREPIGDLLVTAGPQFDIPDHSIARDLHGQPMVEHFRHNVMDDRALVAQEALPSIQGKHRLWFCGGYTRGIGLAEHCWLSGIDAANGVLAAL